MQIEPLISEIIVVMYLANYQTTEGAPHTRFDKNICLYTIIFWKLSNDSII